jgi:hypothetical protein
VVSETLSLIIRYDKSQALQRSLLESSVVPGIATLQSEHAKAFLGHYLWVAKNFIDSNAAYVRPSVRLSVCPQLAF